MTATTIKRPLCLAALVASVAISMPAAVLAAAPSEAPGNGGAAASSIPQSSYSNANNKPDPFLPVALKGKPSDTNAPVSTFELQLQGIIWHPTKPAAVVNRQRIELNETVTFKLNSGSLTVKVIAIDRNRVVLKSGEQQIELRLARE
jgi:hypothetical protein